MIQTEQSAKLLFIRFIAARLGARTIEKGELPGPGQAGYSRQRRAAASLVAMNLRRTPVSAPIKQEKGEIKMPHITLPDGAPGIIGPMIAYPETQRHLSGLAEVLLRGPSSLTSAERELIAAYVSSGNECYFCTQSHAAAARVHYGDECRIVDEVLNDARSAPLSAKMKALLAIADKVRRDGRLVQASDVERARAGGADDKAIHDTVLIAAVFCMFNRYVDGLGTWAPRDPAAYRESGQRLANQGYVNYDFSKG